MHFKPRFLTLALAVLAVASFTVALSIRADGRADVAFEEHQPEVSAIDAVVKFDAPGSAVMAPGEVEIVRRAGWTYKNNQHLLMAIVVQNGAVATAACALGNPLTCGVGVIYSVFSFFFAAWLFQDRELTGELPNPYFVFPPTPTQTLRQRLSAELEVGKWHYVGHVHHQGLNHTVEYLNSGGIQRFRARTVPFWNETLAGGNLSARSDEDNDGGFVGDYGWRSNDHTAYNAFGSTPDGTSFFAANAGGWMVNSAHAIAACADFTDGTGTLDNGVLTLGWNNQGFQWNDGESDVVYSACPGMLGL